MVIVLASYADALELRARRARTRRSYAAVGGNALRRIRAHAAAATDAQRELARGWYPAATRELEEIAHDAGMALRDVAIIAALLSPRCRWDRNLTATRALLTGEGSLWGPLPENVARGRAWAAGVLEAHPRAPKTLNFAANLSGDLEAVTVDVWATRAAVGRDEPRGDLEYAAIARSYRTVARELEIPPAELQALVWIVVRGSAD